MPTSDEWDTWLDEVKKEAIQKGISENTIKIELSNISPQKKNNYER